MRGFCLVCTYDSIDIQNPKIANKIGVVFSSVIRVFTKILDRIVSSTHVAKSTFLDRPTLACIQGVRRVNSAANPPPIRHTKIILLLPILPVHNTRVSTPQLFDLPTTPESHSEF